MSEKESGPRKLNLQSSIDRLRNWSVEDAPQYAEAPLHPEQLLEQYIRNTLVPVRTSLQFGDELDVDQWSEFKALLEQRVNEVEAETEKRRANSQDTLDTLNNQSADKLRQFTNGVIELGDDAVASQSSSQG